MVLVPKECHIHDKLIRLGDSVSSKEASLTGAQLLQVLRNFGCVHSAVEVFAPLQTQGASHTKGHPEPFGKFGRGAIRSTTAESLPRGEANSLAEGLRSDGTASATT